MNSNNNYEYSTLDEIRRRKDELRLQIDRDNQKIDRLWSSLFVKRDESTRGEFISSLISHSALAIDTFLMVRKLNRNYGELFSLFKRKKKS